MQTTLTQTSLLIPTNEGMIDKPKNNGNVYAWVSFRLADAQCPINEDSIM